MGATAGKIGVSMGLQLARELMERVEHMGAELTVIRRYITARRHFTLPFGGQCEVGESRFNTEAIAAGQVFVARRLMVQGPEGAKLQLYVNSVTGPNFREVVTNVQEYANDIPGDIIVEGPAQIIAVVTGVTKAGSIAGTISGYLLPKLSRGRE